jgi:hypothetical protein
MPSGLHFGSTSMVLMRASVFVSHIATGVRSGGGRDGVN